MSLIRFCLTVFLLILCCGSQASFANNTADSEKRLLVLGDSLTSGYGLAEEDSFPAQLERALRNGGHAVIVVNAGVSGDTTAGGLARLDWSLASSPDLVLVELGGNDALRGLPPEDTLANLDALLKHLKDAGIPVLLTGMKAPRNLGEDYTSAFDRLYPLLADKYKIPFYPFFLEGVVNNPTLNQNDGIHPNAAGVAVIVEKILPVVITAFSNQR